MSTDYELVIGLEVHAQLKTDSKLFSPMRNAYGSDPNTNVNEICAGLPGVLPVLNERVVDLAILAGAALGCQINEFSQFARKNYFYPDLPKGYQISQFEFPICSHGRVEYLDGEQVKSCPLTRIHLEEDAGKLIHVPGKNVSHVDLNRAGVPLVEIVSEPDLRTADEAVAYLKALRTVLLHLGVCDGNMEEGSFRCDANCSVRPVGQQELGVKVEVKNLNSFKFVKDALAFEYRRQVQCLEDGEEIFQETRLWRENVGQTVSMRRKEGSDDYRYFPDPDLPPLLLDETRIASVCADMPELPMARRQRYLDMGLSIEACGVLVPSPTAASYFDEASALSDNPVSVSNWLTTTVLSAVSNESDLESFAVTPSHLAELVGLIDSGDISGKIAKDVFQTMCETEERPAEVVARLGLKVMRDTGALEAIVLELIEKFPGQVAEYRAGKIKLRGFFVGQIMRATSGKADPKVVQELLGRML